MVLQILLHSFLIGCYHFVHAFSTHAPTTYSFSVPLVNERPKPTSFIDTFKELWNDPRPISSLISNDRSNVGERKSESGTIESIPYCIISEEFTIDGETFQILLYPRGRFVGDSSSASASTTGPASAYLRYLPKSYGDEIDIAWKLQLCNDNAPLLVSTAGGLPKSNTTWSAALTFCEELESVESAGRATDWGSSIWRANEVCNSLDTLYAKGEVTVFAKRSGESSFALPLKGGIGAVLKQANAAQDSFNAGEVIVTTNVKGLDVEVQALQKQFIYPGIDYRIMTMSDKDGNQIFTTESLESEEDKAQARLALRPCGWKTQQELWKNYGMQNDWPIEVTVSELSKVTTTRFNFNSAIPRVVSAFQRDWFSYSLALAVALSPIPLTLAARTVVSLYDIPSASMEPTLLKGDVLLVEKFPGAYDRSHRGDVVLFQPPQSLRDVAGSQILSTSLFVKRLAGLPGDEDIRLVENNNVVINGISDSIDRTLCADNNEPLRLIEKLLENGKGKEIDHLGIDETYVLGDCKDVSIDSRVWGTLPKVNIVGRPVARIWPLNRISTGPF